MRRQSGKAPRPSAGLQPIVGRDHRAAVEQRHLDVRADARVFALVQSGQNGLSGIHARRQVDYGDAELQGGWLSSPFIAIRPASPCTTKS